jgi:hypothetical protein
MVTYFSLEDLFTSVKCTLIVDTFCRHFIVPHHLLALASVTLHVFQQHIHYTLLWTQLLAAYNMWDTPQVPCPFITVGDTILFSIPAPWCCASVLSQHLTSSNAELYSGVAVSPDLSSFLCFQFSFWTRSCLNECSSRTVTGCESSTQATCDYTVYH